MNRVMDDRAGFDVRTLGEAKAAHFKDRARKPSPTTPAAAAAKSPVTDAMLGDFVKTAAPGPEHSQRPGCACHACVTFAQSLQRRRHTGYL